MHTQHQILLFTFFFSFSPFSTIVLHPFILHWVRVLSVKDTFWKFKAFSRKICKDRIYFVVWRLWIWARKPGWCLCMCTAAAAAKSLQSCPTLCDPQRRQPTRLPRPWDSPGKNTGVGCHLLLQCMKVKSESEDTQLCPTLSDPRLLRPWDFPGKSTGLGCHCLLRFSL